MKTRIFTTFAFIGLAQAASAQDCRNDDLQLQLTQCTGIIEQTNDTYDKGVAYLYRCQAQDMLGNFTEALFDCKKALIYLPEDASIFNSLSIIHQNQKDFAAAVLASNTAIELSPKSATYHNTRANAYCYAAWPERSVDDRLKAMELGAYSPKELQELLASFGYYNGPADGDFGPRSKKALTKWTEAGCP